SRQRVRATSGVGADPSVVEECELPCRVAIEPVGDAVRVFLVVEANRRVGPIAPWPRLGPTAPTQGGNRWCRRGLTQEVPNRCAPGEQVGTVLAYANATFRIGRNVTSSPRELGDSLLGILLPDVHQIMGTRARLEQRCATVGCTRAREIRCQLEHGLVKVCRL